MATLSLSYQILKSVNSVQIYEENSRLIAQGDLLLLKRFAMTSNLTKPTVSSNATVHCSTVEILHNGACKDSRFSTIIQNNRYIAHVYM